MRHKRARRRGTAPQSQCAGESNASRVRAPFGRRPHIGPLESRSTLARNGIAPHHGAMTRTQITCRPAPKGCLEDIIVPSPAKGLALLAGLVLTWASVTHLRAAEEMEPLAIKLPMIPFKTGPSELPSGLHIEPLGSKPRAPFLAPKGATNVALKKNVTSSDQNPIAGTLDQINDGKKEAIDDMTVELHKGVQWVQIDLGQEHNIYAIVIWHDHRHLELCRCVVVQVADDPEFTKNVRTLFNNDYENLAKLGAGQDKQYFELHSGKLIDAKGTKACYVRCYSNGSNVSAFNCYQEIEVYGLPAK
jgi:hypothetical protein